MTTGDHRRRRSARMATPVPASRQWDQGVARCTDRARCRARTIRLWSSRPCARGSTRSGSRDGADAPRRWWARPPGAGLVRKSCERCIPRFDGDFLFCCTAMTCSFRASWDASLNASSVWTIPRRDSIRGLSSRRRRLRDTFRFRASAPSAGSTALRPPPVPAHPAAHPPGSNPNPALLPRVRRGPIAPRTPAPGRNRANSSIDSRHRWHVSTTEPSTESPIAGLPSPRR